MPPGQSEYVCLASLFEGGARRAEGVSCVSWECPIVRKTPPQSLRASMNRGMIATGNHGDFDSLRGAQPQRGRRGRLPFNEAPARRTRQVPLVGAAVPGCPAVGGCRCHRAKANTNPVPGRSGTPAPTRGGGFVRSHWVRSSRRGSRPRLPGGGRLPLPSGQSEYEPGARAGRSGFPLQEAVGLCVRIGCVPLVGAAVPGCPAVGGCRCHRARANTNPVPGQAGQAAPYKRRWAFS